MSRSRAGWRPALDAAESAGGHAGTGAAWPEMNYCPASFKNWRRRIRAGKRGGMRTCTEKSPTLIELHKALLYILIAFRGIAVHACTFLSENPYAAVTYAAQNPAADRRH